MQYSTLIIVVYRPYSTLSCPGEWEKSPTVTIYGDGVLLYEAPSIMQEEICSQNCSGPTKYFMIS